MLQVEATGYFKRLLVVGRKEMALCFVVTDGEDGYDAETLEELLESEGIKPSDLDDRTVTISISTDCA